MSYIVYRALVRGDQGSALPDRFWVPRSEINFDYENRWKSLNFPPEIAKNIWRPPDRQIGDLAGAKYHQKSPKKKYGSKCLKLPNSARNAIKIFSRAPAREYC